jgi:hypothetical protein
MKVHIIAFSIAAALCSMLLGSCGQNRNRLDGQWKLVAEKSGSIDPWSQLALDIHTDGSQATLVKRYSAGNALDRRIDSMTVNTDNREEILRVPPGRWLGQVSMGIYYGPGTERRARARINPSGSELQLNEREILQTAQGTIESEVNVTLTLVADGSTLQWSATRSTRTSGPPLTYTFTRIAQ